MIFFKSIKINFLYFVELLFGLLFEPIFILCIFVLSCFLVGFYFVDVDSDRYQEIIDFQPYSLNEQHFLDDAFVDGRLSFCEFYAFEDLRKENIKLSLVNSIKQGL